MIVFDSQATFNTARDEVIETIHQSNQIALLSGKEVDLPSEQFSVWNASKNGGVTDFLIALESCRPKVVFFDIRNFNYRDWIGVRFLYDDQEIQDLSSDRKDVYMRFLDTTQKWTRFDGLDHTAQFWFTDNHVCFKLEFRSSWFDELIAVASDFDREETLRKYSHRH